MNSQNSHLTHEQWLIAVLDRADLDAERQSHLLACPDCQQELKRIAGRLSRLGRRAANLAPKPSRPFRLPAPKAQSLHWGHKPAWALAVTCAILLIVALWHPQWLQGLLKKDLTAADLAADRQLMQAVDAMVKNALPTDYQQIAGLIDPQPDDGNSSDNDLMDWLVPSVEDGSNNKSLS
ncbi:MAG: hypothetical protein M0036_24100 [Desulfobacteraceae bacterium]|nr:hypothetical protein [Desulfobacteraceae bacterium]